MRIQYEDPLEAEGIRADELKMEVATEAVPKFKADLSKLVHAGEMAEGKIADIQ